MDELFQKYRLTISDRGLHLYDEDLSKRDFCLESTTPYRFSYKGTNIEEGTWKRLLPRIADFLFSISDKTAEEALQFRVDWTKQPIFYSREEKANMVPLQNKLFLNCNFTAVHSVWCLQDLLDFFGIPREECKLIIHRPCGAEPPEIRDYFLRIRKKDFSAYLKGIYQYDDERIVKIISNIDFFSKNYLSKFSKSYDNLFLFDSGNTFYNYTEKLVCEIEKTGNEKQTQLAKRYTIFLRKFYASILNLKNCPQSKK